VLEKPRPRRAFRRITGAALDQLLPGTGERSGDDTGTTGPDGSGPVQGS
ncbi:proteasome subunit alpha, partial [Rhodococcus rhodochrous]